MFLPVPCGHKFQIQSTPCELAARAGAVSGAEPLAESTTKPHDGSFVIGDDDLLAINVWKEPDLSRSIPVRLDGRISLPLVGELQAAGRTPLQLELEITDKLRTYIAEPEVTVMVQEIHSEKFNVLGQVMKPGHTPHSCDNGSRRNRGSRRISGFCQAKSHLYPAPKPKRWSVKDCG